MCHLQLYYNKIKPDCVHGFLMNERTGEDVHSIVSNAQATHRKIIFTKSRFKRFLPKHYCKTALTTCCTINLDLFPNRENYKCCNTTLYLQRLSTHWCSNIASAFKYYLFAVGLRTFILL
jgi:hypothetical protein